MTRSRIGARADGFDVTAGGVADGGGNVPEALDKARDALGKPEHVVQNDDMAVGAGPAAATDDGAGDEADDFRRDFIGNGLNKEHLGAGFGEEDGRINDFRGLGMSAPLGQIAALLRRPLGQQPNMGAGDNAGGGQGFDDRGVAAVHFKLDGIGTGFADEACGVGDGGGYVGIGREGHVGHDKGMGRSPADCRRDGDEEIEGHDDGGVGAEYGHGGGVADQEYIDARGGEEPGGGGVVNREHRNGLMTLFLFAEHLQGHAHGGRRWRGRW
jgi:hypothetical protein